MRTVRGVDAFGSFIHAHPVIHAHDFQTSFGHRWQELSGAHAKVNTRYHALYMVKGLRGTWQYVFTLVLAVELARLGVKELHGIAVSINLNMQVVDDGGY